MAKFRVFAAILLAFALAGLARAQETQSYALRGTPVTPATVIPNGTILVNGQKIDAVGANVNLPAGAQVIDTDSFIFPGLIDLHNHITWNLFPRWPPAAWKPSDWDASKKFGTRYDWQQIQSIRDLLEVPHQGLIDEGWGCEMNRYGLVKAIAGGATSTVEAIGPRKCVQGLARLLETYSGFYQPGAFNQEKLVYNVFPFETPFADLDSIRKRLASGEVNSFLIHLAEGAAGNASAAREYSMFVAQGFLRPGVSILHGVAIGPAQLREMAAHGVGLVWSPRSDFELYGSGADVRAAKSAGVVMSIAPDWSPTGSSGMLEELKYAAELNARQNPKIFDNAELLRMATVSAAQLAGLSDKIGALAPGYYGDLLLLRRTGSDPYAALVHASPLDVRLVVIGGKAVYGDRDLMVKLHPAADLEPVGICRTEAAKVLYLSPEASQGGLKKTWLETQDQLASALRQWNVSLAGLAENSDCPK